MAERRSATRDNLAERVARLEGIAEGAGTARREIVAWLGWVVAALLGAVSIGERLGWL